MYGLTGCGFRGVNVFYALLLMAALVSLQPSSSSPLSTEGETLLRFRDRVLKDPSMALSSWNGLDPCSWFGVECSNGRVVVLNLRDLCLEGTLGPELGELTHLRSIILRNNSFSGDIPREISHLTELEILDLGYNNFSGPFPSEITDNLSLTTLLLDNNESLNSASHRELKTFSENLLNGAFLGSPRESLPTGGISAQDGTASYRRLLQRLPGAPTPSRSNENRRKKRTSESSSSSPSHAPSSPPTSTSPSPSPSQSVLPSISLPPESSVSPSSSQWPETPSPSLVLAPTPTSKVKPRAEPPVSASSQPRETKLVPSPTFASTPKTNHMTHNNSKQKHRFLIISAGVVGGSFIVLFSAFGFFYFRDSKVVTVKPWATGLSGQLRKAFITGLKSGSRKLHRREYGLESELPPSFTEWHIYRTNFFFDSFHSGAPKLNQSELQVACEDFSNIIGNLLEGTVYKGTLSSGIEIAVTSAAAASPKEWSKNMESQFQKKIETLSRLNHKNFLSLIGYCEEEKPFTRMMVFEYAPNGTLFEHLHIKESEQLNWQMRLRIAMGVAYCLQHMHQLSPPIAHRNVNSSSIYLTEDYAAKLSDFTFWHSPITAKIGTEAQATDLQEALSINPESNVFNFGLILFEMLTGRIPDSMGNGFVMQCVTNYLRGKQHSKEIVDSTLCSYQEDVVHKLFEVIEECLDPEPKKRPKMREITERLKEMTGMDPEVVTPKLSPLWWAELEITSDVSSNGEMIKV